MEKVLFFVSHLTPHVPNSSPDFKSQIEGMIVTDAGAESAVEASRKCCCL